MSETEVILPGKNGNGAVVTEGPVQPALMNLISEAVRAGNVEVVAALIKMRNEEQDRDREIAANKAFARMWRELPQIERKGKVDTGKGKYSYAVQEDIDTLVRPIMALHGFAARFRSVEEETTHLIVEGELIHEATGWVWRSRKREPIERGPGQGIQQAGGAAQTYAIRYITVGMLNLVLKGEDTDGRRERGPISPPPMPKQGTEWAKMMTEKIRKAGEDWHKEVSDAFAEVERQEDLDSFLDLIRHSVNELDEEKQKPIGAALMKARARLSERKPAQDTMTVYDSLGETDGEVFTDAAAWVREFMEYWNSATNADDRENLLHHNADALAVARKTSAVLLKSVDDWIKEQKKQKSEDGTPLTFSPVLPPKNRGKPDWNIWLGTIQQELFTLPTNEDLPAWIEAQREVLTEAEVLPRQMAIKAIAETCDGAEMDPPDWLRSLILPINAAASHREWGEARIAELYWVTNMEEFEAAKQAAYPRMRVINKEDITIFHRVKAAFEKRLAGLT